MNNLKINRIDPVLEGYEVILENTPNAVIVRNQGQVSISFPPQLGYTPLDAATAQRFSLVVQKACEIVTLMEQDNSQFLIEAMIEGFSSPIMRKIGIA